MNSDFETQLSEYCREARLTAVQTEIVELYLILEMPPAQIRLKTGLKRVSQVQAELAKALRRLQAVAPGFWEEGNAFPRHLLAAVRNRPERDERPRDVRGVTPDREAERAPRVRMVTAGDRRLRQDLRSAARLWARSRSGA